MCPPPRVGIHFHILCIGRRISAVTYSRILIKSKMRSLCTCHFAGGGATSLKYRMMNTLHPRLPNLGVSINTPINQSPVRESCGRVVRINTPFNQASKLSCSCPVCESSGRVVVRDGSLAAILGDDTSARDTTTVRLLREPLADIRGERQPLPFRRGCPQCLAVMAR